jgi:hypothetical protein
MLVAADLNVCWPNNVLAKNTSDLERKMPTIIVLQTEVIFDRFLLMFYQLIQG